MHDLDTAAPIGRAPWTCPFCPLLCDSFGVDVDGLEEGVEVGRSEGGGEPGPAGRPLRLVGSDCPRATAALAHFDAASHAAQPQVDGRDCDLATAIAAAAALLAASRQPLFGGLGTDVAGARALYALACATGAICDAADGASMMHGLRALQDRGGFSTTLAEVHTRADLVVCMTELPEQRHPELWRRLGRGVREGMAVEVLPLHGDLFDTVALLAALVAGRVLPDHARGAPDAPSAAAVAALAALAARLQAARYAVLVYEPARLPAQGALIVEAIGRIVGTLNRSTRAASLALGGGNGASTVNQVFTWLSGLPLRSRAGPLGLEHEPLCFDAQRLLAEGAVDSLLWISSYGPEPAPPPARMPTIVLGHPRMRSQPQPTRVDVFIPLSTPGIGSAGHLFRTDGSVLLPLHPVLQDGLPRAADVIQRLTQAVRAQRLERAA